MKNQFVLPSLIRLWNHRINGQPYALSDFRTDAAIAGTSSVDENKVFELVKAVIDFNRYHSKKYEKATINADILAESKNRTEAELACLKESTVASNTASAIGFGILIFRVIFLSMMVASIGYGLTFLLHSSISETWFVSFPLATSFLLLRHKTSPRKSTKFIHWSFPLLIGVFLASFLYCSGVPILMTIISGALCVVALYHLYNEYSAIASNIGRAYQEHLRKRLNRRLNKVSSKLEKALAEKSYCEVKVNSAQKCLQAISSLDYHVGSLVTQFYSVKNSSNCVAGQEVKNEKP